MNVEALREEFPILKEKINGKQLVYLDNAATTQKPLCVIEAMSNYYLHHNANVHRGVHTLSQIATDMFEKVREQVRSYLNAAQSSEIIYTKGATEGLNLIAETLSQTLKVGDEIIISESEHHSNIVPWQLVAEKRGLVLKVIPMNDEGCLQVEELDSLITEKTRVISVAQVSNSLGVVHDLKTIISKARAFGGDKIKIVVDGAQGIVHSKVDVRELDCDFYCFSAHKLYAPMGVGIVYGKQEILETLPPYQGGGEMIKEVSFDKTTFNVPPYRFEAGTPSVADVIGLGAALEFLEGIGLDKIFAYEDEIMNYAQSRLKAIDGVRIYAESAHKAGSISFNVGNVHPFDVGTLLDQLGIAIRTGHHCAQPVMKHFGIPGTARASFALYTTKADIDALVNGLERIIPMLL
ncbi:MAG: cysteine desulfurase [Bacteroidales bacterium]|nr:cysteine desulfurase [Bacteroidales bacterium]